MRLVFVLVVCMFAAGCAYWPAERTIYRKAADAVRQQADIPDGAELAAIKQCTFSVAKNAAAIIVPYSAADGGGSYTVRFKRVARTWIVERCYPTPRYDS